MKPITISAMVAGVHAGRINAEVFIFSRSFSWTVTSDCWNRNGKVKTPIQDGSGRNRVGA
jgi:hypothetical protein